MKTQLATSPIFTQGIESSQVSNMDMDLEGMKQACQIFRDNIYTDKILAVVREWVSNAVDEHLKHGIEQPVQTGVKEGRFFVRDFANGLDDNGIRNVFGKYFRSTKSNSDQPIGGFGVGAKAGHCYQDVFYVTSFYNGTKTVYSCVLGGDESGASIGQVIEMSQEPTNESGLLVEIDIKEDRVNSGDTSTFVVYAQAMADYATLANIEVIDDSGNIVDGIYKNNNKTLILEKDSIRFYSFESGLISSQLFAITMGGVKYHTPESFKGFSFEDQCSPMTAIQIDVPVGFFEVPISREFFRETAKFTNGIAKCEAILGEFINQQKESLGELTLSDLCVNKLNKTSDFKFKNNAFVPSKVALSLAKIGSLNPNNPLAEHNGRKLVLLVSDSYHHRGEQVRRIEDWCKTNNKSVLYCTKQSMEYVCSAISQYSTPSDLVFRAASTIYPKNTQGGGVASDNRYTVYRRGYGSKSFRWSALELHNEYWGVTHTEDDAKQFLAQIPQSNNLKTVRKIVILENGFCETYSFKSVLLQKDLIALGYLSNKDQSTVALMQKLEKQRAERDQAMGVLSQRLHKCRNLLSRQSQGIFNNKISRDPHSTNLEKRIAALEKITDQLKNNKNELVATFTKLALENYYFQVSRSDVRKFIKAAK